ncbi:MAG: cell division protein ZapA [Rhizobiales bacterium]|nr:cell division protein ZapA [Hyphomicrobiales bacterium]
MAHVSVTIAGRAYRMACGDGEEAHLEALAREVDAKIADLRASFGEIGDQRITVMAALTYADELQAARRRLAAVTEEAARLAARAEEAQGAQAEQNEAVAAAVAESADRLERLAAQLNGAG